MNEQEKLKITTSIKDDIITIIDVYVIPKKERNFYLKCLNVDFHNILEQYRKADIFVLPCVIAEDGSRDIIPNVLIEAMAMKLPVISTPVTGGPEIDMDASSGVTTQYPFEGKIEH